MKLRNKKTEEIGYLRSTNWNETALIIMDKDGVQLAKYTSLAELNEEWEDYEEPKEFYYINENGGILKYVPSDPEGEDKAYMRYQNRIGNYFETKEEAEKAVEKLKAWERLKDKITCIDRASFDTVGTATLFIRYKVKYHKEVQKDLDLLFGGKE